MPETKGERDMPRPCKRRRICAMPGCGRFGPKGSGEGQEMDRPAIDGHLDLRCAEQVPGGDEARRNAVPEIQCPIERRFPE